MKNFKGLLTLFMALVVQLAIAQEKTVTGTVTDQTGLPLPGANIQVKETSEGTQTDFDGNYTITAGVGQTLVFSYIGMKTVEVIVSSSNTYDVTLEEDAQALDEVVVTGLGIQREKKALGYSQQSVSGEAIQEGKQVDINNALAGKVSGVQIVGNSSSTFGNSEIKLRGESGVLYVVDGVFVDDIGNINPADIEDMSVLKGASATAIYGPEGLNGVLVITTKTAKSGKATFSIDHTTMINQIAALPDYQNEYGGGYSQTFNTFNYDPAVDPESWASFDGQMYPDFWADESWGPRFEGQMVRHWDSWVPGTPEFGELRAWEANPNNVKNFYNSAPTFNTTLDFAKAGEGYNVRSSINLVDEEGIIPNSKRKTVNFSTNAAFDITEKFKVTANVNYQDRTTLNNPDQGYGGLGSNMNQWWQRQLDMSRLRSYQRNGQIVSWNIRGPRDPRPLYWDMPYFQTYENLRNDEKNAVYGKLSLTYKFDEHFDVLAEIRSSFTSYYGNDRVTTKSLLDPGYYSEYQRRDTKEHYFAMANYKNKFLDDKLDVQVSVGGDMVDNKRKDLNANTNGDLTIPEFYNLAGSQDPASVSSYYRNSKTKGMFAKASLGYANMLYLDGSYRVDWSSTVNPDDNSVTTYGISGSFLVHELFPQNDFLTFAKLRAGYASAPYFPNPYQISATYDAGSLYQGNGTLSVSGTQNNPNLIGGVRDEYEIGTELSFLRNRIGFDVTYFNRIDDEIPTYVSLDGSTGYTGITLNSGRTTSTGVEFALRASILKSEDFSFDISANLGTLKKVVDEIYNDIDSYEISTYTSNMRLLAKVGEEYGAFYATDFARHTDGSIIYTSTDKFAIASNVKLGSLLPDYTYGLTANLRYKNLGLFLGFDGQHGGLYYSRTERYMDHSGLTSYTAGENDLGNPLRDPVADGGGVHIQGVLQTGTDSNGNPTSDGTVVDTYVDAQDYFNSGNLGNIYSNNVHDASYLKLRTIKLTYTFGTDLVGGLGLDSAQVSVLGNNVWLIDSDLPWIDPSELEKRSGVNWAEGGNLPMTSSFGLNVKLTF
ncbi:SusC/RagA family TonB-linked outer membrane protein [Robertkochia solimangrovi]|uniref:SusC/RagA family TonB-linked outer membrane protein n=1 Tax=Robertkochia solimangrovi TaxID=2213046 RepID=UPI00117EA75D|nr:SusC/RagA family TonB-linked outer membrane protein [Robertkochia solimangrovi]TRZ41990.1 SusC/RagA family TonB-linked outer membrane protein [Robertkochia solimangrovi]